ncbi:hypothetical protein PLICRDRAFT_42697 [Plicaturopsis crispa FD-325 SS-3]|nr:hypothetical protein PLICRDRAFT_42697 [Plicaturopsis crispa FD-325 SS-3]
MTTQPTVYLVSGASRGIGLGFIRALATRPNTIIFAGARTPSSSPDLQALAAAHPGKVHIVELTAGDVEGNRLAAERIGEVAGRVDVVIANAGICKCYTPVHETPAEELREHFEVNVIGTITLFQALRPLLLASPHPKFVAISTVGGSIEAGAAFPFPIAAYGASKAAENWLARKIHFENESFVSFAMHPGSVLTDMARYAYDIVPGTKERPTISVAESVTGMLGVVDNATREERGGTFVDWRGATLPW